MSGIVVPDITQQTEIQCTGVDLDPYPTWVDFVNFIFTPFPIGFPVTTVVFRLIGNVPRLMYTGEVTTLKVSLPYPPSVQSLLILHSLTILSLKPYRKKDKTGGDGKRIRKYFL